MSLSIDPSVLDKYRAGFNECRNEVMRFLSTCDGVTVDTRTNLLSHLASCIRCIQSLTVSLNLKMDVVQLGSVAEKIYGPAGHLLAQTCRCGFDSLSEHI